MPSRTARIGPLADPGSEPIEDETGGKAKALALGVRAAAERSRQVDEELTLRLARLACAWRTEGNEGDGALEAVAVSASVSRQSLQEFVTLTTRWEPEEIVALLRLRDGAGRAVTRSVLLRLARGPCALRVAFDEAVSNGDLDLAKLFPEMATRRRSSGTLRTKNSEPEFRDG